MSFVQQVLATSTTPDTWPTAEPMSILAIIGVFVGIPVALFVVIALISYYAALKSHNHVPDSLREGVGDAEALDTAKAEAIEAS